MFPEMFGRNAQFELLALFSTGGWVFITVIACFFVVLAFRRDSITHPRVMRLAVLSLITSLMLPLLFILLQTWYGRGGLGVVGILIFALCPVFFVLSIGLALFSLLPPPDAIPVDSAPSASAVRISVTCPDCNKVHQVPESYRGRRVECSGCGGSFAV